MQVEKMLEKYQNLNEEEKKCVNIIVKEKDQNLSEEGKNSVNIIVNVIKIFLRKKNKG